MLSGSYEANTAGARHIDLGDCYRPILLKEPGLVSMAEKYAPEIEILAFSRGFWTWISSSSVQKKCFPRSVLDHFGKAESLNKIGYKRTFASIRI